MKAVSSFSLRNRLFLLLALAVYALFTHWNHLDDGPSGMHTWTQSDHYALTRGFVANGLDFFHPQTFVYHYHYPDTWNPDRQSLITSVDFPIHDYIPAVIMRLTGSESPMICALYMLFVSVAGLFYLYRLAHLFNASAALSLLIVGFVACSPVFTFYQIRFIPSVPSLSTAIIGLYYGFFYRKTGQFRHFGWGMAFLSLAALTRLTFLIPLLAWMVQEGLILLREREDRRKKLFAIGSSLAVVAGYFLYNDYLRRTYGGMFLNAFMPAKSLAQFTDRTLYVIRTWKYEYFTRVHYVIVAIGIGVLLYRRFRLKLRPETVIRSRWFIVFLLTGSATFYVCMNEQFLAHDYYALDVFFVPTIVLLCILSSQLVPLQPLSRNILVAFTGLSLAAMAWMNHRTQENRHASERWGLNTMTITNFEHSEYLLQRLRIPADAKLVILDPLPRNIPFLFMHRTGYVVMHNDRRDLEDALKIPMTYYVFQNEVFLSEVYKTYPEIIDRLEVLGTDGKISVCRKTETRSKNLFEFLQLSDKRPVFATHLSDGNPAWEVKGEPTAEADTWNILPASDFGPVLKWRNAIDFRQPRVVFFKGQIRWNKARDVECVTSFTENAELKVYKVVSMLDVTGKSSGWCDFQFLIALPASAANDPELSVYLWNTQHVAYEVRKVECRLF